MSTAPFVLDRFLKHIPEIERRIEAANLDAIVWGIGPTAWLLPWMRPDLLAPLRKWTSHDGCRVIPANDLVLMDPAQKGLHSDTVRYKAIVDSLPDRIWCINSAWDPINPKTRKPAESGWIHHLTEAAKERVRVQRFRVWDPNTPIYAIDPKLDGKDRSGEPAPDTIAISPSGTAMLAWKEGARRIGVIGVDMMPHHCHNSSLYHHQVDVFMAKAAQIMHEAGGALVNLSPVTSLERFATWKPSASSSAPTSGSVKPEPKPSSNTAFVLARPATFPLPGCEAGMPDGR